MENLTTSQQFALDKLRRELSSYSREQLESATLDWCKAALSSQNIAKKLMLKNIDANFSRL